MKTDDFDYYLPEELIAQVPIEQRDSSRLLVLDKNTGEIKERVREELSGHGIGHSVIETEGRIRENITIHPECGKETRISLDNFFLSADILRDVEKKLLPLLSAAYQLRDRIFFCYRLSFQKTPYYSVSK
mgnify:CR=1 FL=1